ncbi:MAG: outer membrane lipoprotein chaperone LolA [Gammaproteobacteria bacterium]|nr:outer membrane lipoprotein chaperone LolA [Gammaproteobacteria bacterium]NIR99089.1 outer membrane lipoprotein chaperone LolA [Gammaproteobacteria bacterium]NIT64721.1 outer membrane lipoprotein chaperone LolA [Gammaproteobacteria bacterium]NIV21679.1 outer membrane lipoprotein chaperone LolA [Gammaproteobacteria bacterium]NIX10550.1 outer membrane lipoprotein chaperone LolA [Gammaproteobacteria bacterium]
MKRIDRVLHSLAWLFGLVASLSAAAGEGTERLNEFYREVRSLQAQFDQVVFDETGEPVQESGGEVALQRPDRFRWDYRRPYRQLIVGDGQRVWIYDPDLQQVTVKPLDRAGGNTPSLVLSGTRPLEESFRVHEAGRRDGLVWVELVPREAEADFQAVRIGFGEELEVMELTDNFEQVTRIRFRNLTRNPGLDPGLFEFTVPEGVDVVREGL